MSKTKNVLSDADLQKIGFKKPMAKVLACLNDGKEMSSFEIERFTELRQPEVSIALNQLKKNGFITCRECKIVTGKGRPRKFFKLVVPFDSIISERANAIKSEMDSMLEAANSLIAGGE